MPLWNSNVRNSSILSTPKNLKSFGDDDIDSTGFKVFAWAMLCYAMLLSFSSPLCEFIFKQLKKQRGTY